MAGRRWEQLAASTGIVFAVLLIVGGLLFVDQPSGSDSPQEVTAFFADSAKRTSLVVGAILWGLAAGFFLWFVGSLRAMLRRAEGEPGRLSGVAFGGGVAFSVLFLAAAAAVATVPGSIDFYENLELDPGTGVLFLSLTFWLVAASAVGAAVLMAAASVVGLRTKALPAWLGWGGLAAALASLLSIFGWPFIAVPVWAMVVSALLVMRGGARAGG